MNLPVPGDNDLKSLMAESRLLAIRSQHGFIHATHVFVAMLTTECLAHPFCVHLDKDAWLDKLKKKWRPGEVSNDATLPLTMVAEDIVMHAGRIAQKLEAPGTNSVHVLLALLSIPSQERRSFEKAGIIFEDIAMAYAQKPLGSFSPQLPAFSGVPRWVQFILLPSARRSRAKEAETAARRFDELGLSDHCIKASRYGLRLDPKNHQLRIYLAYALLRKLCYNEALPHFQLLSEKYPNSKDISLRLAYVYNQTKEHRKAAEIFDHLLATFPDDDAVLNDAGFGYLVQGRYAEAITLLEKATAIRPDLSYPWNNLGFARFKLGETSEALRLVDKSLQLDKANAYAYKNKGIILLEQGNKEEAIRQFQLALKFRYTERYGPEVDDYLAQLSGKV